MKNGKTGLILCLAGAAGILIGILLKQPASVYEKAVRICLECVGIG